MVYIIILFQKDAFKETKEIIGLREENLKLITELEAAKSFISALKEQKELINQKHSEEIRKSKQRIQADYDIIVILKNQIASKISKNNQLRILTREQIHQKNEMISKLIDLNSKSKRNFRSRLPTNYFQNL